MASVRNLDITFDDFRLQVPDWVFPDTGVSAIWGRSGSGKSTLLQIIAGLIPTPRCQVHVNGKDINSLSIQDRNVGMVFQDYGLFPHLSARDNILFGAQARGIPEREYKSQFEKLTARLGLTRHLDKKPSLLSGGEQQRTALARALLTRPNLVLLDEPFSALDEHLKIESRALIAALSKEFQIPFILVTHDIADVRSLASHVLLLSNGKVEAQGLVDEVVNNPVTLEAALIIPENQFIRVEKRSDGFYLGQKRLDGFRHKADARTDRATLVFKPWAVECLSQKDEAHISGKIMQVTNEGALHRVQLILDGEQSLFILVNSRTLAPGQEISLRISEKGAIIFTA